VTKRMEPAICSLTALIVRCKAFGFWYMPMRSIALRNMESCVYAAALSDIFESSKHITGFGVRWATLCAFMLPEPYTVTWCISKHVASCGAHKLFHTSALNIHTLSLAVPLSTLTQRRTE